MSVIIKTVVAGAVWDEFSEEKNQHQSIKKGTIFNVLLTPFWCKWGADLMHLILKYRFPCVLGKRSTPAILCP